MTMTSNSLEEIIELVLIMDTRHPYVDIVILRAFIDLVVRFLQLTINSLLILFYFQNVVMQCFPTDIYETVCRHRKNDNAFSRLIASQFLLTQSKKVTRSLSQVKL